MVDRIRNIFSSTTNATFSEYAQLILRVFDRKHDVHGSTFRQRCCPNTFQPWLLLCGCESSGGPNCLGYFLSLFGFHLSPMFGLRSTECLTLNNAKVTKSLVSSAVWHPFFLSVFHSSFPHHFGGDFVPNTSTIVPSLFCASMLCGCRGHLSF